MMSRQFHLQIIQKMTQINPEQIPQIKIWDSSFVVLPELIDNPLKPQFKENYQKLLSFSGLQLHKEVSYRNVQVQKNVFVHQIFTIPAKNAQLPHLVYLHGFGATSMDSYRLLKFLHPYYQVHALDRIGDGFSSTGNFSQNFSFDEARSYLLDGIEEWRKASNIKQFVLLAHSYGGYLGSCYAIENPERIKKLILFSPLGFTKQYQYDKNRNTDSWMTTIVKKMPCIAQKLYNMNITPQESLKNCFYGKKSLYSMIPRGCSEQEKKAWKIYITDYMSRETTSQRAFYTLFKYPVALPDNCSIKEMLKQSNIKFPVDFYYGDRDWMNKQAAQQFSNNSENSRFFIISKAGHKLILESPEEICRKILQQNV